jgi:hypothetical protein
VRQGGQEGRQAAPEYVQVFRVAQVAARGSRGVVEGQERAGKPENKQLRKGPFSALSLSPCGVRRLPDSTRTSDIIISTT